jgi:hypothetical protein
MRRQAALAMMFRKLPKLKVEQLLVVVWSLPASCLKSSLYSLSLRIFVRVYALGQSPFTFFMSTSTPGSSLYVAVRDFAD